MKKGMLFLLYSLAGTIVMAQSNSGTNSLATPTSNNTFLSLFGPSKAMENVDVDLYTGTGKVSIPICDLDSRELHLPVSFDYVGARGIKVQDVANDVGLGWQLNAGGQVTRVIRGNPDEEGEGYLNHNVSSDEPDIFYVRTPYFYFHFVFDAGGNPVMANGNGYKIIHNLLNNSNDTTTFFEVIDDLGNQYYFGSTQNARDIVGSTPFSYQDHPYTVTFSWYLDKIVTFNSKDIIKFNYIVGSNYRVCTWSGQSESYTTAATATTGPYYNSMTLSTTDPLPAVLDAPLFASYTTPKYISSIISTLGTIEFTYATGRLDFPRAQKLSAITLKAINPMSPATYRTVKKFTFNYSHFGSPATDSNQLRLRLDNIQVTGTTTTTAAPLTIYSFDYNTTTNLPARNSPKIDFLGYFNNGSGILNPDGSSRTPVLAATMANILTTVHNVAGESISLSYELNDYYNNSINNTISGLRVNKVTRTLASGEKLYTTYSYLAANGKSSGTVYGYPQSSAGNVLPFYNIVTNFATGGVGAPGNGVTFYAETFSSTPYNTYDLEGNYIGYSSVKVISQNGGYAISNFTSFKDIQDVYNVTFGTADIPTTAPVHVYAYDYNYKRGLLTDKTIYDAGGNKIKDVVNTWSSQNAATPLSPGARSVNWGFIKMRENMGPYAAVAYGGETYGTMPENYRLTQSIEKTYDQANPANYLQKQTSYTYGPNHRLVRSITTMDSKGLTRVQNYYHPDDTAVPIPMVTDGTTEQTAVSGLLSANATNIVIHETENTNGTLHQLHNVYQPYSYGNITGIYLGSTAVYSGSALIRRTSYNYDRLTSNLISSIDLSGQYTSTLYGYNKSLPIANISNAGSTSTLSSQQQTLAANYFNIPGGQTFTTTAAGTIMITLGFGENPGTNNVTYANYSLTGAGTASGTLCNTYNNSCGTNTATVTLPNMPAGTYNLTASGSTTVPSSNPNLAYTFTTQSYVNNYTNEFFIETFEENPAAIIGNAHSGGAYLNRNDTVTYSPPNSRKYIIQWWNYAGGKWNFNEQTYAVNMILTGPVDDIRVFPADARVNSYTYSPIIGMTSRTDSVSQTSTTEYDGLGRRYLLRDGDKNILKEFDYQYQVLSKPVKNLAQSHDFTRNNCTVGGTGSTVTYLVPAGKYSSIINQADADLQATNDNTANGQNYANTNGTCTYANTVQSGSFTRSNCSSGTPSTVVYTIPAGAYTSNIDQPTADSLAAAALPTGGPAYANANGTCTFSSTPQSATFTCACTCLYIGSQVTYTVPAGTYISTVDQATADALALAAARADGQAYANANGTCKTLCKGTNHKIINCNCELGVMDVISASSLGGKCVTKYGYFFSDGTYVYDHTTTTTGGCQLP